MEWLYLAAVFNGAFLALAVPFIKTRNRLGKYFLSGIFAILCFALLDSYLGIFKGRDFFGIGLLGEFYLGPLIYLFSLSLISPSLTWQRKQLYYFLPAIVATVTLIMINTGVGGLALSDFLDQRFWGTGIWVGVKIFCIFGFFIPAYLKLSRHLKIVPTKARKYAGGVKVVFLGIGILLLGVYVNYYLFFLGLPGIPDSDNFSLLLVSFMLFLLGLMVIVHRPTLDGFPNPAASRDPKTKNRIMALIEEERVYLDPDLTLKALSGKTGISEKHLSQAFHQTFGKSFLDLINEKRVEEFKALVKAGTAKVNILELAFEAGFNSKATFYRAFRSLEGISPSAHLKMKKVS